MLSCLAYFESTYLAVWEIGLVQKIVKNNERSEPDPGQLSESESKHQDVNFTCRFTNSHYQYSANWKLWVNQIDLKLYAKRLKCRYFAVCYRFWCIMLTCTIVRTTSERPISSHAPKPSLLFQPSADSPVAPRPLESTRRSCLHTLSNRIQHVFQ